MSRRSSSVRSSTEEDSYFTNARGERFHYTTFAPSIAASPGDSEKDMAAPVLLCVHGAGMSGDSFFRMARELQSHNGERAQGGLASPPPPPSAAAPVGHGLPPSALQAMEAVAEARGDDMDVHIMAYDQRCHGLSTFAGGEDHLTIEVLTQDFLDILHFAKTELYTSSNFFVMGHSLGGAVVARALQSHRAALDRVSGFIMVDIVEGTALLSLAHMSEFLKKRPTAFSSVKDAETWFLRAGGMQSPRGAEVSVPPLLKQDADTGLWHWRTDLAELKHVWGGWFKGLDEAFVSLPCAKMLCTANAERLDKALTVAQMQGKFQFEIIGGGCGHYVMDDATMALVAKVRRFVKRNEVLAQKLRLVNQRLPTHYNNTTVPPNR